MSERLSREEILKIRQYALDIDLLALCDQALDDMERIASAEAVIGAAEKAKDATTLDELNEATDLMASALKAHRARWPGEDG